MKTYKVLDFLEDTGQLIIHFAEGMGPLSVDVPIDNGKYMSGEELDKYIQDFIPTWHIERLSAIRAGVSNVDELKVLVPQTANNEVPSIIDPNEQQNINNKKMWEEVEFERKIAAVLVKLGVLPANPTTIPVETL